MKGRKSAVSPDQILQAIMNFKQSVIIENNGIKSKYILNN